VSGRGVCCSCVVIITDQVRVKGIHHIGVDVIRD
jgi:hypothetical protein